MSGFFKKLFNRIVGKEEGAAPEPVQEQVEVAPEPLAVEYHAPPAPEPEPVAQDVPGPEDDVVDYEIPGPEDDVPGYEIPGPGEDAPGHEVPGPEDEVVEDEITEQGVVQDDVVEEVQAELEPETLPEPEPEPEPEPVVPVAAAPAPAPEAHKPTTLEKLKSFWPLGKKKAEAQVEVISPPPPVIEPPPLAPEPEQVVEEPKPEVKAKKGKAKAKEPAPPPPPKPEPKTKTKKVEEEVARAPEPALEPPTPAPVQKPAAPVARAPEPAPAPLNIDVQPAPAARPASGLKKEGQKAALRKVEAAPPAPTPPTEPEKKGWFSRLKDGLSKSSKSITTQITTIFKNKKLDRETLQDLEDTLIQADLGITVAERIIEKVSAGRYDKEIDPEEVKRILADEVAKVLAPVEIPFNFGAEKPFVILVVGVNGSGKTTTIGKLGAIAMQEGFKVKFAACDTFRAAAIEQLTVWGKRIGAETIWRPQGADAAGLAFDAMKACHEDGTDILFIDTAGRLHNKTYLMDELDKVVRVIKKYDAAAPHAVLLVLDATTGQNALAQAEAFTKVAGVTGLIMTKLDGTARGGILVAIAEKFKLPIHAIGVGETLDDLQPFDAQGFARAIAGLDEKKELEAA